MQPVKRAAVGAVLECVFKAMSEQINSRIDVHLDALTRERAAGGTMPTESVANGPTFYLETFGCQMNVHDSEKVAGVLFEKGYRQVETPQAAGLVLYNTCSIREKAAQKLFSRLGEFRFAREGKLFGVLGCVAQQEGEAIFKRAPWVNLVCGSASYRNLPEMIDQLESGNRHVTGLDKDTDETFETEITRRDHPFRAYITIIEGCDKACTYCVVPFTRGPERSRASASVLEEARRLADAGYTEIQLLGQTVNSYCDPSPRRLSFSELLIAVADTPGIRRVRFTTSHPSDFGPDIVAAIDAHAGVCDHVHLPVQSGSSRVLRAMQRTYTREQYLEKIVLIQAARRPISITTDFIVGFPGETEAEFEETLSLLNEVQYDGSFSFKYSPRPNTTAQHLPGAIPEEEQGRRLAALQDRQRQIQTVRNEIQIGQTLEVLVDGASRSEGQWAGRTSGNRMIKFASPRGGLLGQYVQVHVSGANTHSLVGDHVI
jgi:tRNA-2-methylthio-N6-dimethylallyladenosine synthase